MRHAELTMILGVLPILVSCYTPQLTELKITTITDTDKSGIGRNMLHKFLKAELNVPYHCIQ
jgi:hypothetical protein